MNMGDILFTVITILLLIVFFVSITLFFKIMLINQSKRAAHNTEMEQKLDKVIELLERDKSNQ